MFFPGETITHTFVIPFGVNEIREVVISYKQNGSIMLEKTVTSGFISDGTGVSKVELVLSQSDSLLFDDNADFTIQINVYTVGGTRHASHELKSSNGIQYLRELLPQGGGS